MQHRVKDRRSGVVAGGDQQRAQRQTRHEDGVAFVPPDVFVFKAKKSQAGAQQNQGDGNLRIPAGPRHERVIIIWNKWAIIPAVFREDYVRRMIDQAVTAVTTILGLIRLERYPEALSEVDGALQRLLG